MRAPASPPGPDFLEEDMRTRRQFLSAAATGAAAFAAAPSVVSSVIPGARTPEQVKANVQSMTVAIPDAFWEALKKEGLIARDAPVPSNA